MFIHICPYISEMGVKTLRGENNLQPSTTLKLDYSWATLSTFQEVVTSNVARTAAMMLEEFSTSEEYIPF